MHDGKVATTYCHELEAKLLGTSELEPLSLKKRMEEVLRKAATNPIGYI
jgi:hypothetical protein